MPVMDRAPFFAKHRSADCFGLALVFPDYRRHGDELEPCEPLPAPNITLAMLLARQAKDSDYAVVPDRNSKGRLQTVVSPDQDAIEQLAAAFGAQSRHSGSAYKAWWSVAVSIDAHTKLAQDLGLM
jgi:hypothetical protein